MTTSKTVRQQIKETFAKFKSSNDWKNDVPVSMVEDAIKQAVDNETDFSSLSRLVLACANEIGIACNENVDDVLNETERIVLQKNLDYGSSFLTPLVFLPNEKPELTVLVRLSDKAKRYENLKQNRVVNVVDESIEDTLRDIIGYCVLLAVARQFQGKGRSNVDESEEQIENDRTSTLQKGLKDTE